MSFVTLSRVHFPQHRTLHSANGRRLSPRSTNVALRIIREAPLLLDVLLGHRKSRKTNHDFGIPEQRLFYKHLRLSEFFGETNGLTASQTRNLLRKLYISGPNEQRSKDRLSQRLNHSFGGSSRIPIAAGILKTNRHLSHSGSSGPTFGLFTQLNAVSSRSRSRSLSHRRSSLSLQLQLPFHSFVNNSFCQPGDACHAPFTPHSQIMHTPPCPPEIPRLTNRGAPTTSTSPPWSTNAFLTPIFETSVSGADCWMSPVIPSEPIQLRAPRRLSYSRTSARKNSLSMTNFTEQTLISAERLLASPVTIKPSSCVPQSPTEIVSWKDSIFSYQGSPTTVRV